ncbi:hypothetical protein M8818_003486 [Zalaria obscura]|uniref:Uncharacterized protein n=1 Tax=Zalaria obscura TaxID=2024903 RepID=A0ACC3SED4_9PEZI
MSRTYQLTRQFLSNLRKNITNMAQPATDRSSLSATTEKLNNQHPAKLSQYSGLEHPPAVDSIPRAKPAVKPLEIKVEDGPDGTVPGFLHVPHNYDSKSSGDRTAAILLSGAGGGVVGPSSIYLSMADKLASLNKGIPALRLDYRFPARNRYCVRDVVAAMDYLQEGYAVRRFVLVGWSFGGAPVFTVGGQDERVVGCATVASQTAETEGIRQVGRRQVPLLLLHGTGDRTLSPTCSQRLYDSYGNRGPRELKLFNGDDHALTRNSAKAEELLCGFITKCAGVKIDEEEQRNVVQKTLVDGKEKIDKMKQGGDLRGSESVE